MAFFCNCMILDVLRNEFNSLTNITLSLIIFAESLLCAIDSVFNDLLNESNERSNCSLSLL